MDVGIFGLNGPKEPVPLRCRSPSGHHVPYWYASKLLITSQHPLPSPRRVRRVLRVYLVMEDSTPSNCQRPDTDGKYDSLQGCQLCKKVLAKYVMYDHHDYILDGVCPVMDGSSWPFKGYDSSFWGNFLYDGCVCCLWIFLHLPCAFSPFRAFALCFLLVVLRPIIM